MINLWANRIWRKITYKHRCRLKQKLHKLQSTIVNPICGRFSIRIEATETYIDIKSPLTCVHRTENKVSVGIAADDKR